jgi:Mg-chelatase subunit ChlD
MGFNTMLLRACAAFIIIAMSMLTTRASAATNVLFIIDSSGSMLERVDGSPKIVTAKRAIADMLRKRFRPKFVWAS